MDLIFVTGNDKKYSEVKKMLDSRINLVQQDLKTEEIQTTSLEKISADKAMKAFEILQKPLIVEDTGCYLDAYNKFPGALSKFVYEAIGQEGYDRLLKDQISSGNFVCVFSYMSSDLEFPLQFVGEVKGKFDFGENYNDKMDKVMKYNHIFYPENYEVPVCEIYDIWQEKLSHRVNGVRKLNEFFASVI